MSFAQTGGSITGAFGGRGPKYRGYKVGRGAVKSMEKLQGEDIARLHGRTAQGEELEDPWSGPGLGYSDEELQLAKGLSSGDVTAARQRNFDRYSTSPYGTRGREFQSAEAGIDRAAMEGEQQTAAQIALASAGQKRQDLYGRLGEVGKAYGQRAGLFNDYARNRYQADMARFQEGKNRYAAVGQAAGGVLDMWSMGVF